MSRRRGAPPAERSSSRIRGRNGVLDQTGGSGPDTRAEHRSRRPTPSEERISTAARPTGRVVRAQQLRCPGQHRGPVLRPAGCDRGRVRGRDPRAVRAGPGVTSRYSVTQGGGGERRSVTSRLDTLRTGAPDRSEPHPPQQAGSRMRISSRSATSDIVEPRCRAVYPACIPTTSVTSAAAVSSRASPSSAACPRSKDPCPAAVSTPRSARPTRRSAAPAPRSPSAARRPAHAAAPLQRQEGSQPDHRTQSHDRRPPPKIKPPRRTRAVPRVPINHSCRRNRLMNSYDACSTPRTTTGSPRAGWSVGQSRRDTPEDRSGRT